MIKVCFIITILAEKLSHFICATKDCVRFICIALPKIHLSGFTEPLI